jgi:multiple sugar transport system permease protein
LTAITKAQTRLRGRRGHSPWARRRALLGLAYVSPALIIVTLFFLIPLVLAFWISLTEWNVAGFKKFVGLDNYIDLLTDKKWIAALQFTTFYTVVVTILTFAMGFGLALLVRTRQRRFVALRTAFYLPVVIGIATASFIFLYLFNDQIGAVNALLKGLGLIDQDVAWLADPGTAFLTLLALTVWKNAGFAMITLLIAMQAVPEELYEAARVDGASARQSLRRITVPLILPTIALVVLLLVVGSYLAFDQFYIITRGGPNNSTITATYWIYNQAFVAFKFGYSTAMSVVLMLFLVVLGAIQLRILRRDVTGS